MERAKGFEPSTLTLARLCSTPELHPHSKPRTPPITWQGATRAYMPNRYRLCNPKLPGRPAPLAAPTACEKGKQPIKERVAVNVNLSSAAAAPPRLSRSSRIRPTAPSRPTSSMPRSKRRCWSISGPPGAAPAGRSPQHREGGQRKGRQDPAGQDQYRREPAIAGQLGVQSIPNVFAFAGGRPVDVFLGNYPRERSAQIRRQGDRRGPGRPAGAPARSRKRSRTPWPPPRRRSAPATSTPPRRSSAWCCSTSPRTPRRSRHGAGLSQGRRGRAGAGRARHAEGAAAARTTTTPRSPPR